MLHAGWVESLWCLSHQLGFHFVCLPKRRHMILSGSWPVSTKTRFQILPVNALRWMTADLCIWVPLLENDLAQFLEPAESCKSYPAVWVASVISNSYMANLCSRGLCMLQDTSLFFGLCKFSLASVFLALSQYCLQCLVLENLANGFPSF